LKALFTLTLAVWVAFAQACSQVREGVPAEDKLPLWLVANIAEYDRLPLEQTPREIWKITHKGRPTYFVISRCCDMFNPLLNAKGLEICSPSGGIIGAGDGECSNPVDAGTEPEFVWSHPAVRGEPLIPPEFRSRKSR
jgi:hypothetical protein